jgi:Zn-finger nucleic acid-binding protein
MSERQGIEIDYCPQCRGVWLDRGELDKIIERSSASVAPAPEGFGRQASAPQRDERSYPQHEHYKDDRYKSEHYKSDYHHRKKKGFLGELFDFD